jgi:hypothetical protein
MAGKENEAKVVGSSTATDIVSTSESDGSHELFHFARRGQALTEASSTQESIDGYDPELMNGRTLLTAEEEKKLLRKIDWRLMTLCSLIFMFKNLDSNNVSIISVSQVLGVNSFADIECSNNERGNKSEHNDTARNHIGRVQPRDCPLLCKISTTKNLTWASR